jgi:hypothetical protein
MNSEDNVMVMAKPAEVMVVNLVYIVFLMLLFGYELLLEYPWARICRYQSGRRKRQTWGRYQLLCGI